MRKLLIGLKKAHGHVKRIGQKVIRGLGSGLRLGGKAVGHITDASQQVQGLVEKAAPLVNVVGLVGGNRGAQLASGLERVRSTAQGVEGVANQLGDVVSSGNLILRQSANVLNNPAEVMATARAIQTNAALGRQSLMGAYGKARLLV